MVAHHSPPKRFIACNGVCVHLIQSRGVLLVLAMSLPAVVHAQNTTECEDSEQYDSEAEGFWALWLAAFCMAFGAIGTCVCLIRSCCAEWTHWHPDAPADGGRACHPIKFGIWVPTILGFCIFCHMFWSVLAPIAYHKHCKDLTLAGALGDLAGGVVCSIIFCCLLRFRPKADIDQAGFQSAQAAFAQARDDVAAQLQKDEEITVTVEPSSVQVSFSKSYHLKHILANLPYEDPASAATATLSLSGTPLGVSTTAQSLRDIDGSIETDAVLHLSGATLNPSIEHIVVPPPRLELSQPNEQDYVKYIQDPKELRCWHVYSPSSYEYEPSCCSCEPKHPWGDNQKVTAVGPAPPDAEPAEARLTKLNELKQAGLVTEEEYNQKRAEILDTV